jgi:hypothetical protein
MSHQLKAGMRLRSAVCATEVIVVRAPSAAIELECGGVAMLTPDEESRSNVSLDPLRADGTLIGKRYADEDLGLELLCTKAGEGSLTISGESLALKDAKPLPSSD